MDRLIRNFSIFSILIIILASLVNCFYVHKKFEYKYSFKPPYLAQRDGSVPFWEYGGNAIASSENVRLAPSLKSQKGAIWTKNPLVFEFWEVDVAFRISGRGRIGADGLALWYTQNKGAYDGDVFGSSDQWNGLGIFFDSFDNDNKHNNPYIYAVLNDGTRLFDHQNDGTTQQLAGCLRDFRNKPFPTRVRLNYHLNVLTLMFHNGMSNNDQDFEMCFRVENVLLPKNGYFGVSAATGGLADDHDVIHFLTSSYSDPGATTPDAQILTEDQQKLQQEYLDYQRKLEQQKEDYRKEHPDETKSPELEDWFETDGQRELRQIFQGQNQIFDVIKELNQKLDDVASKQEQTLNLVVKSAGAVGTNIPPPPAGQQLPAGGYVDTIRRHEVDALFNNQNQVQNAVGEIRQFILEVKQRIDTVINNQARAPTAQVQSVGYDTQSLVSEMRDGLNSVKVGMSQVANQLSQQGACPKVSCVSVTTVLIIVAVQLLVILGYNIYRDNKDSHAKKFY
ncbi:protein ERGIC-53 [Euwallacea fornicatus]|uniref:protein ERGIC-53 n=1 Tax=Euwallacea fornicatus TaxID=995702 RepID=UPI0033900808